MPRKPQPQANLLDIPEQEVGEYSITHTVRPPGYVFDLNTPRTAIFGQRGGSIKFDHETRWHTLKGPTGVWMTDLPIEQKQTIDNLTGLSGRVLVGGLGLGVMLNFLAPRVSASTITVVEKSQEVLEMVEAHVFRQPELYKKVKFVNQDLFDFLLERQNGRPSFYTAFYDIWQADNENTFHSTVVPLHLLSTRVVRQRPHCWNEDIMRGQKQMALLSRLAFLHVPASSEARVPTLNDYCTVQHTVWVDWAVPFFRWIKRHNPDPALAERGANLYAAWYGEDSFLESWCAWTGMRMEEFLDVKNLIYGKDICDYKNLHCED